MWPPRPVRLAGMGSRVQRGGASGPAEWLLVFLEARDVPPRTRSGAAAGPAGWLLAFLEAASGGAARVGRPSAVRHRADGPQEDVPDQVRRAVSGV